MSNHPPGFLGFQSRMEAMAEELGGDWLANRAAEAAFDGGLALAVRRHSEGRPMSQRWKWGAEWTRATDADWERGATYGENPFSNARPLGEIAWRGTLEGFTVVCDGQKVSRLGRDPHGPAIKLAYANLDRGGRASINATDEGAAVAEFLKGGVYGAGLRTKHRHCNAGNEVEALKKLATDMGVAVTLPERR